MARCAGTSATTSTSPQQQCSEGHMGSAQCHRWCEGQTLQGRVYGWRDGETHTSGGSHTRGHSWGRDDQPQVRILLSLPRGPCKYRYSVLPHWRISCRFVVTQHYISNIIVVYNNCLFQLSGEFLNYKNLWRNEHFKIIFVSDLKFDIGRVFNPDICYGNLFYPYKL